MFFIGLGLDFFEDLRLRKILAETILWSDPTEEKDE